MKNILAENMLRFRSKNIAAQEAAAIRKLIEQVTTEIDIKKTMPKGSAALSAVFKQNHDNNVAQVTGIIGPYYLVSNRMSENGYIGGVFGFGSVNVGGSQRTGVMTLPIPSGTGRFVWHRQLPGTNGPGFGEIDFVKPTAKSMTDSNATPASVAEIINELYNEIPLRDLQTIYNNDKNKASYDKMIANFKTRDLERNAKIVPLLKGNAEKFFAQTL